MKNTRGLTLIEVVIALCILVGGVLVLSTSWSGNFMRIRKSAVLTNVALLLERKMTEMDVKYREQPISAIKESEQGDFGEEFKNYRWEFHSQDFALPDLTSSFSQKKDGSMNDMLAMISQQMTEMINQSVKEATVTIFVKIKDKEMKYSATTYFVDFAKIDGLMPSLPGGGSAAPAPGSGSGTGPGTSPGPGGSPGP